MKTQKSEKKLQLNRLTIVNLETLEMVEQKVVKAGSDPNPAGTTNHPVYC